MPDHTTMPTVAERLRRLWQIVQRRRVLLVSVIAVALAGAVFVSSHKAKQYSATAKLVLANTELVGVPATGSTVPTGSIVQNADPQADLNTKVALILAPAVASKVNSDLHLGRSPQTLVDKVQAKLEGTSNIVDVTATDPDPARATAIANAFANEYVAYRNEIARSAVQQSATALSQQIAQLSSTKGNATQLASLQSQLHQLNLEFATQSGGAFVIGLATNAAITSGHPVVTGAIAGLFVGLLLALTLVLVLEMTDRRLKDAHDVLASGFGVRVLAAIPRARQTQRGSLTVDASRAQADAYDSLASQLVLAGRRRPLNTVLVTSPGAGDGKTTVTLGVARALSRLDRTVLVIETDPRFSVLPNDLARTRRRGLTAVVAGASTLQNEIVDLPASIENDGISVLPCGPAETVSHLLARPATGELIADSRKLADFVLIDGPSTDHFHDALALVDSVDAALEVARLRWTSSERLHESLETLDVVSLRLLGIVLTASSESGTPPRRAVNGAIVPLSENGLGDRRAWVLEQSRRVAGSPGND